MKSSSPSSSSSSSSSSSKWRRRVFVIGVGMIPISQAGKGADWPEMGRKALENALEDAAGISFHQIQFGAVGYNYGDPTCGQRIISEFGMNLKAVGTESKLTGFPVVNVNNNCSTGSSALYLARTQILSGLADCTLALGFEKMQRSLSQVYADAGWTPPTNKHWDTMYQVEETPRVLTPTPSNPRLNHFSDSVLKLFAAAAREHSKKYGTTNEQFAKVAEKNHRQSVHNSYALDRRPYTVSEILSSPSVVPPLTRLNSCSTADGASAVILASEDFLKQHSNLFSRAVEILDQQLVTDQTSTFDSNQPEFSFSTIAGVEIARIAAQRIFQNNHKKEEEEGPSTSSSSFLTIKDVDVLEVHDCFSCNELFLYEALGLCPVGSGGLLIDSVQWRSNSQGGSLGFLGDRGWVVNPSGGLESKGHPIGATGLYQTYELVQQLRGEADKKQVPNARVALQHNFGIGSAVVVTLYRKPKKLSASPPPPGQHSKL